MLRIIGNSWKNSRNNSHDVCEVHRSRKHCFLAVISKHEVSKCTACLDGTLRSREVEPML